MQRQRRDTNEILKPDAPYPASAAGEERKASQSVVIVAAVQAAPIYLSLERSLARALELIAEAARRRAQLVVFPETWLPGYPAWIDVCRDVAVFDSPIVKRLFAQLSEQSVVVPGPVTEALGNAARENNLTLVIGVNERVLEGAGRGTLYNTVLTFGPDGALLNRHRKLIPTFGERLIWGNGDGSTLQTLDTPAGRIGSLICWEHWMPLVRQTMHINGEDIHIALWPEVKAMYQIAARHYAFEGRCFVVSVGSIMRKQDLPRELEVIPAVAQSPSEFILGGGSAIIGPDGNYVAGPSFDAEVIILARINLERNREESMALDVTGHYHRPDLFEFDYKAHSLNGKNHVHELPPAPRAPEALPPAPTTNPIVGAGNGSGLFMHNPPSASPTQPITVPPEPAAALRKTSVISAPEIDRSAR